MSWDAGARDRFRAWFEGRTTVCPACQSAGAWTLIADDLYFIPTCDAHGNVDIGRGLPAIVVVCQQCFHMLSFAAKPWLEKTEVDKR